MTGGRGVAGLRRAAQRRPSRLLLGVIIGALLVAVGVVACITFTDRERSSLDVAGYLVPWDPRSQLAAGDGALAEVSPVWFQPTDDGGVVFVSKEAEESAARLRAEADGKGLSLVPSVTNFVEGRWDGELIDWIVTDPQRRSAHVQAIVDLVRMRQLPGIDIDYESLPASSRSDYSAFIKELADALHEVPAQLSVTVHAKTAEPGDWAGAQAQDWGALGAAADEVRVMAYDYSSPGSAPGPIAPPSWVDQVLTFATEAIPSDRLVLGLPTYGYDWAADAAGSSVQWADVQKIAEARGVAPQWDSNQSAPWLRYADDQGREHTVWYEDARSMTAKLDIAHRHGVTQVVLWRLGGEDPEIWTALRGAR